MNLSKLIVCFLVSGGALIMAFNIRFLASVMKGKVVCSSNNMQGLLHIFKFHLSLMIFFLLGYLVVLYTVISDINLISDLFVGIIFFFGALFVLLGIVLQDRILITLRKSYIQAIKMLMSAVEIRDPYTIGHSEHVANISLEIFDRLPANMKKHINRDFVENAGLLHDIGKIGVPEEVLNKAGKLNEDEWKMIRQHAAIGKSLISALDCMDDIPKWIEYHHERMDGKGYYLIPSSEIPLVSRILSTADTYSALVTDRPYQKGKTHHEAMDIITKNAGSQLDRNVVNTFLSIDKDSIKRCRPDSLVIEYLDELRKIEGYTKDPSKGSGIDIVLDEDLGVLCLKKIFAYCLEYDLLISLVILKIHGLNTVEKEYNYHEADELSNSFSSILFSNIRRTDFIVKLRRDLFIIALPQCPISQALKLYNRIQREIEKDLGQRPYNTLLSLDKDILELLPSDLKSESHIDTLLQKLSSKGFSDFHYENFIENDFSPKIAFNAAR